MVWRFPDEDHAIKYGAKLIVRESQQAVFVNEGEIADVLGPGTYELETRNLPVLTKLQHWDHGFDSPFKAEVYFVSTKRFTDLKWGTKHAITLRDPEFSMVRLRAYGRYEIRIVDAAKFLKEIVGTDGHFTIDEIDAQLDNMIVGKLATVLAQSELSVLDMASSYERFGRFLTQKLASYFDAYGLKLEHVWVENISLPEAVEKALDTRTSREVTGDLDAHMRYKGAESLDKGGAVSEMSGMAMGMAMGEAMAQKMRTSSQSGAVPPPPPPASTWYVARNGERFGPYDERTLTEMIAQGRVAQSDYVWREGMQGWERAQTHFAEQFKGIPTPPPPPEAP
jgi:membrane protease subunit (stomatin/prohibitin family)